MSNASARFQSTGGWAAVLANVLIVGTLAYASLLHLWDPDLFYQSVQEDESLEWGTFWAFLIAAGVAATGALRQWRATVRLPWFLAGVSAFCFFVAMEEISWGQRLLGYRPPAYFLEHNFQQELNVHNVVATRYRKLVLGGIILGYGVLLPLLGRVGALRGFLLRAAIVAPPAALGPAFLAIYQVHRGRRRSPGDSASAPEQPLVRHARDRRPPEADPGHDRPSRCVFEAGT